MRKQSATFQYLAAFVGNGIKLQAQVQAQVQVESKLTNLNTIFLLFSESTKRWMGIDMWLAKSEFGIAHIKRITITIW